MHILGLNYVIVLTALIVSIVQGYKFKDQLKEGCRLEPKQAFLVRICDREDVTTLDILNYASLQQEIDSYHLEYANVVDIGLSDDRILVTYKSTTDSMMYQFDIIVVAT